MSKLYSPHESHSHLKLNDAGHLSGGAFNTALLIFCFLFISCNQNPETISSENKFASAIQPVQQIKDTSVAKGVVHQNIFCRKDSSQSYALYLPSGYSLEKNFSIIYFFDSHAEGLLPIEKYKSLAEKYGYIIAGSNNSKNGTPWEITQEIIRIFFDDTQEKFPIDNRRIYTGGFSGGARVASTIALMNDGIAGVVGCGAGFANANEPVTKKFNYIGIAGNTDFNMIELKNLDRSMENSPVRHQLVIFDGKHEWPPEKTMEEAFLFFEINAMKDNLIPKNDSLILQLINNSRNEIVSLKKKNQFVELWNAYKKIVNTLDGITDVSIYKSELAELEKSKELIAQRKIQMEDEKKEFARQQEFASSFTSKNIGWWNNEIKSLKAEKSLESQRLLGYLGLAAYMYSTSALNKNMFREADDFLKIYALIEPQNSEHQYLYARLFMKMNQPEKALSALKSSVNLGFKDKERLDKDELFSPLRNKQGYTEIEELMRK